MKRFFMLLCLLCSTALFAVTTGPQAVISTQSNNGQPVIAVSDGGNNGMAIWQVGNQIISSYLVRSSTSATSGFAAQTITVPSGLGSAPRVAVDQNGNAILVWVSANVGTSGSILASYFNAATASWLTTPVVISTTSSNAAPQISMNRSGLAMVLWNQTNPLLVVTRSLQFTATSGTTATLSATPAITLSPTPFLTSPAFPSGIVPASFGIGNTAADGTAGGFAVWNDSITNVNAVTIQAP